jgi:thioredoxin
LTLLKPVARNTSQEWIDMTAIINIGEHDLALFETRAGDGLQLLIFSAPWCGPCKSMAPALEDIADIYADNVSFGRIDIEQSPALAQQFNVRTVPTLVVRRHGQEQLRHTGVLTRTRLAMLLDDAGQERLA